MGEPPGGLLPRRLLAFLLAVSILTNVVLVARLRFPAAWEGLQGLLHPVPGPGPDDHARGDAGPTAVIYADFQCPFSVELHENLALLAAEVPIRIVYRHFPLEAIHPLALPAAEAAECAAEQGLFGEYVDELFLRRGDLTGETFAEIAWSLPLDLSRFQECRDSGRKLVAVQSQAAAAAAAGVKGTPTIIRGRRRLEGSPGLAELRRFLGLTGDGADAFCP